MTPVSRARPLTWALALTGVVAGCDRYPPDLPLDPRFTHCESADECVVVELDCQSKSCFDGLAVSVRKDQSEHVEERYAERCGENATVTLGLCPPWEVTCDDGICGMREAEETYQ